MTTSFGRCLKLWRYGRRCCRGDSHPWRALVWASIRGTSGDRSGDRSKTNLEPLRAACPPLARAKPQARHRAPGCARMAAEGPSRDHRSIACERRRVTRRARDRSARRGCHRNPAGRKVRRACEQRPLPDKLRARTRKARNARASARAGAGGLARSYGCLLESAVADASGLMRSGVVEALRFVSFPGGLDCIQISPESGQCTLRLED